MDEEYVEEERRIKEKVLKYMTFGIGFALIPGVMIHYNKVGTLFCWEMLVWWNFYFWNYIGIHLALKYLPYNLVAFITSVEYHINSYCDIHNRQNYISTLASLIAQFSLTIFFRDVPKFVYLDFSILAGIIISLFHHMLTHLFDIEGNCLWKYDVAYADCVDAMTMICALTLVIYFTNFLNTKKLKCLSELVQKVEEKSKEKERFFACVSHELRNPLNSLLASVEILPKTKPSKQGELLSSAKSCGDTLLHLIGNILDVSKIQDKKMDLCLKEVDINEVVKKVILMHKIRAKNKGLYLSLVGDRNIPPCVRIDDDKISQVLINLISNSIKFTEKGTVTIKLTWIPISGDNYLFNDFERVIEENLLISNREKILNSVDENYIFGLPTQRQLDIDNTLDDYRVSINNREDEKAPWEVIGPKIEYEKECHQNLNPSPEVIARSIKAKEQGVLKIEIIDSGIGISGDQINKLFHPFAQANNNISQKYGGTGLGLWIANSIVELMGGKIKIESELGNGSDFMVVLPLFSGDEEKALKDEDMDMYVELHPEYQGCRLLYVEDICENQMVISQMLQQLGFIVQIAVDGAEGLHLYKTKGIGYYDIILTDLRMPNMSGQTMIMEIRKFEQLVPELSRPEVPIIVLTGDPSENEKSKCLNILKANAFLVKPISILQFNKEIRKVMRMEDEKEEDKESQNKSKKLILVVEDDKLLSNLIKMFLLDDYDLIHAYTIKEGIVKLKENYQSLSAITLDGNLEDGIGRDFLEVIREYEKNILKQEKCKMIKVISTSGDSTKRQKRMYKDLNVAAYVQKPFSKNQLINALKSLTIQNSLST